MSTVRVPRSFFFGFLALSVPGAVPEFEVPGAVLEVEVPGADSGAVSEMEVL